MAATQGLPPDFAASLKQAMSSAEDIACFLDEMDVSWLYNHPTKLVFRDLQEMSAPCHHALELLLSYGVCADFLAEWLIKTFPLAANSARDRSAHVRILRRLQDYLYFETSPLVISRDEQQTLAAERTSAKDMDLALKELDDMIFSPKVAFAKTKLTKTASRKNAIQAERKQEARRLNRQGPKNESAFDRLDVMRPEDQDEVDGMKEKFLLSLKDILRNCLVLIRSEAVAKHILESSVDNAIEQAQGKRSTLRLDVTRVGVESVKSPTSAKSYEQPMKAALYFTSAAGHGQWEVNVSSRALGDIRKASARNSELFKIVMKKIKALSNAHFSDDNMKQLNKGENAVPVYEAKMTRDTRLVYQIDCVPEYCKDFGIQERQVIKIFGIYSHSQLNRLWESLGFQLAGEKGRGYKDRCAVRLKGRDGLCVPAVFPPAEGSEDTIIKDEIPELPKEDLEEIHSILTLEKYIPFSQELRNSILAELDVAHVFNMSPQEMEIVEHPYSCYVIGRSGTGKTTTMLFKMLGLERSFAKHGLPDGRSKGRQLFVTQSRVLAGKVEGYFTKLMSSLEAGAKTGEELRKLAIEQNKRALALGSEGDMIHIDDNKQWKAKLPTKFSLLRDEHFPLFLTFEKLAEMVIADLLEVKGMDNSPLKRMVPSPSSPKPLLSYERFLGEYWAHFPSHLTKLYDPALVFSEIIGTIKGSEKSLSCDGKHLDEETYLSLGERTNFAFASHRPTLYAVFLKYMQRKRALGEYDAADRTHQILEAIKYHGLPGMKVDFLYVDEAQDNMIIDAMLLRTMCRTPLGLFWAGDTAQTISVGSSFRFEDLKAFLFRLEERRVRELEYDSQIIPPTSFVLSTNYRSHGGIVACAHSIIETITHFWPDSLDKMAPEKGTVNGLKPFFFGSRNSSAVRFEDFLTGGTGADHIEFGSKQCIIVRDESAKERLRERVGTSGIIMTLYDSKGLEFDDVLIYQFFADSTVDTSRWRILGSRITGSAAPAFDTTRHAGLCSELKSLYVAITRARKKLWIYDSSEKSEALRSLWTHEGLIENFEPGSSGEIPRFVTASSREEWEEQAWKFFNNKNFSEAAQSYASAGMAHHASIAATHQLRKIAEGLASPKSRRPAFLAAAKAFVVEARKSSTRRNEVKTFYRIAAGCFEQASDFLKAADAYRDAEEFHLALNLYHKEGKFDEGVSILPQAEKMDRDVADKFKDVAKLYYLKDQEIEKAKPLFKSTRETLEYLEENTVLDESHALLLENLGRSADAAQVHVNEGRTLDAIRVLVADRVNEESAKRARDLVVDGLWELISFEGTQRANVQNNLVQQLLDYATLLGPAEDGVAPGYAEQIEMFSAVQRGAWSDLGAMAQAFSRRRENALAILCSSKFFNPNNFPDMRPMDNYRLCDLLAELLLFCHTLKEIFEQPDITDASIRRLFNFQPSTVEDMYHARTGSWLHQRLSKMPDLKLDEPDTLVPGHAIKTGISDGLLQFIADILKHEQSVIRGVPALTPCLRLLLAGGSCHCSNKHFDASDLTSEWLMAQTRLHMQQVVLCQITESIPQGLGGGRGNRRFWINRLYHTLNPTTHHFGSWSKVVYDAIPEAAHSSAVMRSWCRDILHGREGQHSNLEVTSIYQAADLCFHLDRADARDYVHRSNLVFATRLNREPVFYRNKYPGNRGTYVLPELLGSLGASHPMFITAGVMFLGHVLRERLFIDVNILCNFVDFLCGSLVVAYHGFQWHNIILPRSLCATLVRRMEGHGLVVPNCDTTSLPNMIRLMGDILNVLTSGQGADRLLYSKGRGLEHPLDRKLFIPRICRAMSLVGLNIPDPWLRHLIMVQLGALQTTEVHRRLYGRFADAWSWDDLEWEICCPRPGLPTLLDPDLVYLWSMHFPNSMQFDMPSNCSRIEFPSPQSLPKLLRMQPNFASNDASNTRKPPEPRPENATRPTLVEPSHQPSAATPRDPVSEAKETVDNPTAQDLAISPELIHAATVFQAAYRRALRRRQLEASLTACEVAEKGFFERCFKLAKSMNWPPESIYKFHFLGIVPHLLVCVQWAQNIILKERASAKRAFKAVAHSKLKAAKERLDRIEKTLKDAHRLQKTLRPESRFHLQRNLKELEKIVGEVEELLDSLSGEAVAEVAFDIEMAKKAFRKKQPKKPTTVQVEDIEDWESYEV